MNKKIIIFIMAVLCLGLPAAYAQQETSCTRKVLVQARGDRAAVSAWKKCGDEWKEVFRTEEGWVGRHGVTDNKMEGDGATPLGAFAVRRAFGLAEKSIPSWTIPMCKPAMCGWTTRIPVFTTNMFSATSRTRIGSLPKIWPVRQ